MKQTHPQAPAVMSLFVRRNTELQLHLNFEIDTITGGKEVDGSLVNISLTLYWFKSLRHQCSNRGTAQVVCLTVKPS